MHFIATFDLPHGMFVRSPHSKTRLMLFPHPKPMSSPHRVVVTGAGIVTSLGSGWRANAEGFRVGQRAFRPITLFDTARQRTHQAAEVNLAGNLPPTLLSQRQSHRLDRASKLLLIATHEAWTQAGWLPSANLPVVLGTTSGGMSLGESYYRQATQTPHHHGQQAERVIHYQAQRQAMDVLDAFGCVGPITIIANACASGANAIGHSWQLIRSGRVDRVVTGGYDALSQLVFAGFDSLQALSPDVCRPFDEHRNGLALGEGAAVLALESIESAERRGAVVLGEIIGYGAATDGHHLTQPQPEGNAALASMNLACQTAQVAAEQIDYINAHGTGTPLNDSAEAHAINRWAGASVSRMRVSSTKASVGHLLGAAGAVETIICLMVLRGQWLPPTITLRTPDPICGFSIVTRPASAQVEHVLTNSFGFGGANATLILRRAI